jgi:hypothetical protein
MENVVAALVYVLALAVPLLLLHRFHAASPAWHLLAIAAAIGIGLIPGSPTLNSLAATYVTGFLFLALVVWGIGGLIDAGRHHSHHTTHHAH